MTEAEELELAEAEAEANANANAVSAPEVAPAATVPQPAGEAEWLTPRSALGAFTRGAGQGVTQETLDEQAGAASAGLAGAVNTAGWLTKTTPGRARMRMAFPNLRDLPDNLVDQAIDRMTQEGRDAAAAEGATASEAYTNARDRFRAEDRQAAESHPWLFGGGKAVGSMLTLPLAPVAKGVGMAGRALQYAKTAGLLGGVNAAGASEADSIGGVVGDTLEGGAVAALTGGVLGPLGDAVAGPIGRFAERQAVKAIAPVAGLVDHLRKLGITPGKKTQDLGRAVIDMDVLRPLGSTSSALKRVEGVRQEAGRAIGSKAEAADDLVSRGLGRSPDLDESVVGMRDSLKTAARTGEHVQQVGPIGDRLENAIRLQPQAELGNTFKGLWQLKSALQRGLKPQEFSKLGDDLYREGVAGLTANTYKQLERVLGPEAIAELRQHAARYGNATVIQKLLEKAASRETARAPIGLLDMQFGQTFEPAAKALLGEHAKPALSLLSSLFRGRTHSTLATGADAVAKRGAGSIVQQAAQRGGAAAGAPKEQERESVRAFQASGL